MYPALLAVLQEAAKADTETLGFVQSELSGVAKKHQKILQSLPEYEPGRDYSTYPAKMYKPEHFHEQQHVLILSALADLIGDLADRGD